LNSVFTQWRATAFATLAFASYVCAGAKQNVFAAKPDKLRGTQAGLDSQCQKRTITATRPCREVGSGKQRIDLNLRQISDRAARIALARHGQDALRYRAMFWRVQRDISEEGMDCSETHVATAGAVLAFVL
jgi:hypothetical protein